MYVRPKAKFCVRQKIFRLIKPCVRTPLSNLRFINHRVPSGVRSWISFTFITTQSHGNTWHYHVIQSIHSWSGTRNLKFSMPKAQISNNMTAFGHPFLLSPLILRNCDNSQIYLMQVRCSVGKPQRKKRYLLHLFFFEWVWNLCFWHEKIEITCPIRMNSLD